MDDFSAGLNSLVTKDEDENAALEAVRLLSTVDKDLPMKTELEDPMFFSITTVIASFLHRKGMTRSAKIWRELQQNYRVDMVSKDRKGRQEIIDVLKQEQPEDPEAELAKKLLTRGE